MFSSTPIKSLMLLTVLLFSVGNINVAFAAGGDSTDGEWQFSLAPLFLWAQGIEGTSTIGPVTAPLDITFKDALSNLEATFTVHYEMKKDKLTLFGEYQYVNLGPEAVGPLGGTVNIGFKDTIAELGVAYWVFGTEKTDWEIFGGARYTKQKLDVNVEDGRDLLNVSDDWWVGFFGGRMSVTLSDKWSFIARADYGLGSGDTNSIWNVNAMFDYRFKAWGSVFAGYKYMNYDYDNGNKDLSLSRYAYDASQQGPLIGLNFHW
jgi:predicted porin